MNKFITTNNGGLPYVLDDIRFEQDAVREAFLGLVNSWGVANEESYILNGCEITVGATIDITAGHVVIQGEIYKVLAQSITATVPPGEELVFEVVTSFDPAGNKTFDSGATFDTYENRRAQLAYQTIGASNFKALTAPTIHRKIFEKTQQFEGVWQTIDLDGSTDVVQIDGSNNEIAPNGTPQTGSFLKYNIKGKRVHVAFNIFNISITSFTTSNAAKIRFRNLPFSFVNGFDQSATYTAICPTHLAAVSGVHPVLMDQSVNRFDVQLLTTQGSAASFNRLYDISATPEKRLVVDASTSFTPSWNLKGSFVAEIQ